MYVDTCIKHQRFTKLVTYMYKLYKEMYNHNHLLVILVKICLLYVEVVGYGFLGPPLRLP